MKLTVYFTNKQNKHRIGARLTELIETAIGKTLKHEHFRKNAEVSVTFVDNGEIHALNREFRDKDKPTDVLSFPLWDADEGFELDPAIGAVALGDIVISAERAHEQAEEFGHSFAREVCFLAVHSTLHLIGYDHEVSEYDEKYMNETQEKILAKMGLHRK
ncbi:MAG: rRNA maturation RNase YbeY [Clostridia bacterium]|nr:rRNA maturation RNase YbeY [Clostridia bacterium]